MDEGKDSGRDCKMPGSVGWWTGGRDGSRGLETAVGAA